MSDWEAERHWREHVVVDARGNSVPVRDISGCLYCDALTGRFAVRRKGGAPDDR